jgi:chemotaxis signal transduction protein
MNDAVPTPAIPAAGAGRVCLVWLGAGCFAFDVGLVGEVRVLDGVTPLPRCPAAVLGIANLRGQALAVIDTALLLGLPGERVAPAPRPRVLVLRPAARGASLAGLVIRGAAGVHDRAALGFRAGDRAIEPPVVAGFLTVPEHPGLVATLVASSELLARLDALRTFRATSAPSTSSAPRAVPA